LTDEPPPGADDAMKDFNQEEQHATEEGEDVMDMKMGAMDNSFLIRGNAVDVFRNRCPLLIDFRLPNCVPPNHFTLGFICLTP